MISSELLERVRAKCDQQGDCLVWTGVLNKGHPTFRYDGVKNARVRRVLYEARTGAQVGATERVRACCGNDLCCNPDHLHLDGETAPALLQREGGLWFADGAVSFRLDLNNDDWPSGSVDPMADVTFVVDELAKQASSARQPATITDREVRVAMAVAYESFVATKLAAQPPTGIPNAVVTSPHLFDFQRDLTQWALRLGRAAIFAGTGLGKEQPVSEPVLTPDGWRTMGDLRPGDQVVGSNGEPTTVLGVFPQGVKRVFRIDLSDGSFVRCGSDHLWSVRTKKQRHLGVDFQTLTTAEIAKSKHRAWQLPMPMPPAMRTVDLPMDPYALGVMLGDGCLSKTGGATACTDHWIGEHLGWTKLRDHESNGIGYWKPSDDQRAALRELGLTSVRSDQKIVPAQFVTGDPAQRLALLQGLMDTDGYAMPDGGAEFCSTSRSMIDAVIELTQSLGGVARGLREASAIYTHDGEKLQGKQAWRVNIKLPAGSCPFRMPRKSSAYVQPSKYHPARIIRDVVDEGVDEEQVCIKVSAADELYVTRGHVLTHNTRMELTWLLAIFARTGRPVLIVCPLGVAQQTIDEGAAIGIEVHRVREAEDVRDGINIVNYERVHKLDAAQFAAVALDESSILKSMDGATRQTLTEKFSQTPFRLCLSATPAPNDVTELCNHAEFLGICTNAEMKAEYFVHDGGSTQDWRLKGHAKQAFWRFVATWAALVRSPADLGYDASAYELPALQVHDHVIPASQESVFASGRLFVEEAGSLMERRAARRESLEDRVRQCAELVNGDAEPWIVWCSLNDESDALAKAIPGSVEIRGSNTEEEREEALDGFVSGRHRVVITKSSVTGAGMNWQHCARQAFVGVDDSFERYFQAVRRSWRFGQTRAVHVHRFLGEAEKSVLRNLQDKEREAEVMAEELSRETRDAVMEAVRGTVRSTNPYEPQVPMRIPEWLRSA